MTIRTRKFIGAIALLALVVVYALLAMVLGVRLLADAGPWQHLAFYIIASLGWVIPAMPLVGWMQRPDRTHDRS
jgi:hypothetical protein